MVKVFGWALKIAGGLVVLFALWVWITSSYPEISPFRLFGIFESGIWGLFLSIGLWLRVVAIATIGIALVGAGQSLVNKNGESQNANS